MDLFAKYLVKMALLIGITLALVLLVGGVVLLLWPEQVLHLLLRIVAVLAITAGICLLVPLRR